MTLRNSVENWFSSLKKSTTTTRKLFAVRELWKADFNDGVKNWCEVVKVLNDCYIYISM
jgi:hypothetical protein